MSKHKEDLEDDTSSCIHRKVFSAGKRRRSKSSCHDEIKSRELSVGAERAEENECQWIQNSFMKSNRTSVTDSKNKQLDKDDHIEEDCHNSSDFLMAQIDVESLTGGNDGFVTSSPRYKRSCGTNRDIFMDKDDGNDYTISKHSFSVMGQLHPTNEPQLLTSAKIEQDSNANKGCDSKTVDSFNSEEDLFDDVANDLDSIFFLDKNKSSRLSACVQENDLPKQEDPIYTDGVEWFDDDDDAILCQYENSNSIQTGDNASSVSIQHGIQNVNLKNEDGNSNTNFSNSNASPKSKSLPQQSSHKTNDIVEQNCQQPLTLKEKLKQRLQKNAGINSPAREVCLESKLKKEALSKARLDASQIRKEGGPADIGPFYGLPSQVKDLVEKVKGITQLYDWQDECLRLPAVRDRKNLIYCLPTSGGKTLVAEILILRELLCYQRDALLILPFVSIVQEKVRGMAEFATSLDFLVEEYAGSKGRFPPVKRKKKKSLFIATIEKGHALVNSLIETQRMCSLGLVVVDELHMLGEGGSRGATLESCLLKILHAKGDTQVIGMSATLNNLPDVQSFLKAETYTNNFRPVMLEEYVKLEDNIFSVQTKALCVDEKLEHCRVTLFPYSGEVLKRDPDQILGLVLEVIPDHSCLVFCPTKKNCENVALMLSELMCQHYRHLTQVKKEERRSLLKELYQAGDSQVCPTLSYSIHFGIAYHHSGLTMDERRLIEEAYAQGTLCLLTCTSTLAAGVNLPAKRVILRSPYVGQEFIKYSQYKQMTGRAGRAGLDATGESILITKKQDKMMVKELLAGPKDFCHSSLLYDEGQGIQSLLLSAIGLGLIKTMESALQLLESSLLNIQSGTLDVDVAAESQKALDVLLEGGLLVQGHYKTDEKGDNDLGNKKQREFSVDVTPLGKATFKGCVNHRYSNLLFKDLKAAEQSLVVSNHFHLLYLVTPYDMAEAVSPVWGVYFKRFCQLSETELRVANVVNISENYLSRRSIGLSTRQKEPSMSMKRFYLTLILWDLWNGRNVWDVANRFVQSRGFVQNLLASAASFASCVFHFCQELEEFWAYKDLLGNVVKRLSYCVTSELIPLMEVPGVLAARAKQLHSSGIRSLADLASTDPDDLAKRIEHLSRRNARQIVLAAKNLVEEKTAVLMEEVDTLNTVTDDPS